MAVNMDVDMRYECLCDVMRTCFLWLMGMEGHDFASSLSPGLSSIVSRLCSGGGHALRLAQVVNSHMISYLVV